MAEWAAAYINDLPDSAFACIDAGGKKEDGRTAPRSLRHYPHHNAAGELDLPHLRNALSRIAQDDTTSCGASHLRAHAKEANVGDNAQKADLSFDETRRLVQVAIQAARGNDLYICELYSDRAVYEIFGDAANPGATYQVDYSIDDAGEVTLGDAVEVKREIAYTAVKFAAGTDGVIEGYGIPYGGPVGGKDVHGEKFTAETDLALEWFPDEGRPFLYHHGLDPEIKAAVVGRQVEREPMDLGHWVKVQLDKRSKYLEALQELVQNEALSFSSGAVPHLVRTRKDGHIDFWPWVELSGTPTPANKLGDIYAVKSADAIAHLTAVKATGALTSILERERGLESEPFAAHAERVTAGLDEFVARVVARQLARTKSGRSLSAANRAEIAEVLDSIDRLAERRAHLAELIARSDPGAAEATKALETEFLRFQQELARQNGAPVGAD